jgi:hypothetical protein
VQDLFCQAGKLFLQKLENSLFSENLVPCLLKKQQGLKRVHQFCKQDFIPLAISDALQTHSL